MKNCNILDLDDKVFHRFAYNNINVDPIHSILRQLILEKFQSHEIEYRISRAINSGEISRASADYLIKFLTYSNNRDDNYMYGHRPYIDNLDCIEDALISLGLDSDQRSCLKYSDMLDKVLLDQAGHDRVSKVNEIMRQIRDIEGIDDESQNEI